MSNRLTRRELQCVRLAGDGHSNKEIGRVIKLAPNTVRNHLANAFAKLGTSDRFEAAKILANEPDAYQFSTSTLPPAANTGPSPNAPDVAVALVGHATESWILPRPNRKIWVRLCWIFVFAACSAITVTGIVSLMSSVVKDASGHAPPNAIRSLR